MKHTRVKTEHVRGFLLSSGLKCQSPQNPAEGVSKVTAVLLGNGGTRGGGALGGKEHTGRVQLKDWTTGILSFFFPCFLAVRR